MLLCWWLSAHTLTHSSPTPTPTFPPRPLLQGINVLSGQASAVTIQQVIQLGMFSIITYAVELLLEFGFMRMAATILMQIIQGSLGFFIFRSRTTAYYFADDVTYGGAKYIPTGRGYAIKHNTFVKVYSSYARSHLYYATELVLLAVLLPLVETSVSCGCVGELAASLLPAPGIWQPAS